MKFLHLEMYQYRRRSIALPFVTCVSQAVQSLLLILLPKIVLDALEDEAGFALFAANVIRAGAGLAAAAVLNLAARNEIEKCSQTFLYRRLNVLWESKMLRLDYGVFCSRQGKIGMEKARQAIASPNWGLVELLGKEAALLGAGAGLAVYCTVAGMLHPAVLAFLGLFFLAELWCGIRIEERKQGYKEEKARADRRLNYMAYGMKGMKEAKDIRLFSMGGMLRKITEETVRDKTAVEAKVQRWQFLRTGITDMLIFVRNGLAYLFLTWRYLEGGMTLGDFVLYFGAITGIGMCLTRLSEAVSGLWEAGNYVRDFYGFLGMPEAGNGFKNDDPPGRAVSFQWENVSFSYRKWEDGEEQEIPVFRNLNLTIRAGERLAIVGRNGAGKSTLVKLLCGMLEPDRGRILMDGRDIRTIPRAELYGRFSAVFQHSRILPVSVARNVMLDVREHEDKEAMWDALRAAGLEKKVKSLSAGEETCLVGQISEEGTNLSGGQEQRLLLARALYKDAPVLLLDEPTAALDPIAESEIYEKYGELTAGKTSVFVSHRLASTRFCDRILFLEDGRIAESGSHRELMEKNGKYADMFRVQSRYYSKQEQHPYSKQEQLLYSKQEQLRLSKQEEFPVIGCGTEEAVFMEGKESAAKGGEGR